MNKLINKFFFQSFHRIWKIQYIHNYYLWNGIGQRSIGNFGHIICSSGVYLRAKMVLGGERSSKCCRICWYYSQFTSLGFLGRHNGEKESNSTNSSNGICILCLLKLFKLIRCSRGIPFSQRSLVSVQN